MGGRGSTGGKSLHTSVTREDASKDWFEYENANLMSEYIRTGKMPDRDMNGRKLSKKEKVKLKAEADLMQAESLATNTGQNTLYRGMVMSEEKARALTPGQSYTFKTLTATTPDKKLASVYSDIDNYGGGEGVPVVMTIQQSGGIRGFKRDEAETVLGRGASFRIVKNHMDKDGVVHIELYAKKGKK